MYELVMLGVASWLIIRVGLFCIGVIRSGWCGNDSRKTDLTRGCQPAKVLTVLHSSSDGQFLRACIGGVIWQWDCLRLCKEW